MTPVPSSLLKCNPQKMRLSRRPKTPKIWRFEAWFLVSAFWWFTKWLSTEISQIWPTIYKEPWMQENGLNKFRTNVSEVSSLVGNPVHMLIILSIFEYKETNKY